MPHEKINHPDNGGKYAVVGWNKIGWVQLGVFPDGWKDTGDAYQVSLSSDELDKLIRTLKRAKRQAYATEHRHYGFEDRPALPDGSDLWPKKAERDDLDALPVGGA